MSKYIEDFWEDAKPRHVADVMNGKEIEARFSDRIDVWATTTRLRGVQRVGEIGIQWMSTSSVWNYCQVYQPPEWWRNKPDPGEEYRLLDKFPDEALQPGDEAVTVAGLWHRSEQARIGGRQVEGIWYRRRIEPPKPEPKYAVGQRVRVVRPKQKPSQNGGSDIDEFFGYADIVASVRENGENLISYVLEGIDKRAFPEDYLEAFVEPKPKHYVLEVGDSVEFPGGVILKASLERGIYTKNG